MQNRISLQSRKELAQRVRERYNQADWKEKTKILDGLIASCAATFILAQMKERFAIRKSSP